ncbi:MAG: hypothetical protein WCE47_00375 [Gaiella sp.]|uniref:hypothetical protein n=1 Tax=Gaiella sp. TaxID=2663207 RepID=UPI003C780B3A
MRFVLLAAAAVGAWLFLRRRRAADERHVVVGWADGSELVLGEGSSRERLVAIAEGALR